MQKMETKKKEACSLTLSLIPINIKPIVSLFCRLSKLCVEKVRRISCRTLIVYYGKQMMFE